MKYIIILVVLLSGLSPLIQAQSNWSIQPESKVTFKIKNAGFNVNGSLGGLNANIKFSPDQLANSKIEASVEVKSIDTGVNARDKHLKKEDYFHVEKYPKIEMVSQRIAPSKSGDFIAYFKISIKGVTKDIKVPFKYQLENGLARFNANFTLNRLDYGVGGKSFILANNVKIRLDIIAKRG